MHGLEPQPGNPWPHDMRITIDEPYSLTYLLFVRHAWQLPVHDLPELDPVPSVGLSARPPSVDVRDASIRWHREWNRAWSQFEPIDRTVREPDGTAARLLELPDDQLADAVSTMPSPFWAEGIDGSSFGDWRRALHDDHTLPLEQHPERIGLDALVPAWRSGLLTIIQLPYRGYFAHRLNRTTLVVSRTTRHDPGLYRKALGVAEPGGSLTG